MPAILLNGIDRGMDVSANRSRFVAVAQSDCLRATGGQPTMGHIFASIGHRKALPLPANDHDGLGNVFLRSKNCTYYDGELHGELKVIPGFAGFFASESGHIFKRDRMLKGHRHSKGYCRVTIRQDGSDKNHYVHSLVALAWHGPRPEGCHVDHIDFDRSNNIPTNIRYLDARENCLRRQGKGGRS